MRFPAGRTPRRRAVALESSNGAPLAKIGKGAPPAPAGCGFEYLDHTADIQLHSWGPSLPRAFEQVTVAMFAYMTELATVEVVGERSFTAEGHDLRSLLYNFMDECLYVFCTELFVCKQVEVERNLRGGAVVGGTPVEIWTTTFSANIDAGLHLGAGSSGVVEKCVFRGGRGLALVEVVQLAIRKSEFVNATLGLYATDSAPDIRHNLFSGNATAIRIAGDRVPVAIRGNTFAANATAIENLSATTLDATDNFWGTTDSTVIVAQIEGPVDFSPFLYEEGEVSSAVQDGDALPDSYALYPAYPNPCNAEVTLAFDLPQATQVELAVFDALGRRVASLVDAELAAGAYRIIWDTRDKYGRAVASGAYLYGLRAADFTASGRLALVR